MTYFYYQIQIFSHKQFSFTSWNHSPLRQNRSSWLKTITIMYKGMYENVWVQGADLGGGSLFLKINYVQNQTWHI